MWKRIIVLSSLVAVLPFLASCQVRPMDAQAAAKLFIQGEFYLSESLKEPEFQRQYRQAFGEEVTEETQQQTMQALQQKFTTDGGTAEISKTLSESLMAALNKSTSFTTKKAETKGDIVAVSVEIYGLDQAQLASEIKKLQEAELLNMLHEAGFKEIKALTDLTELTSSTELAELTKLIEAYQKNEAKNLTILTEALTKAKSQKASTLVKIELVHGDRDDSSWRIQDEDRTISKLAEAFLGQ